MAQPVLGTGLYRVDWGEALIAGGRPSFERLSARLVGRPGRGPLATFVDFDVLEVDGESLVERPWSERRQALAELQFDSVRAVANMVCNDGEALFAATGSLGVGGIVARRHTDTTRSHPGCAMMAAYRWDVPGRWLNPR